MISLFYIIIGLVLLVFGGNWLLRASVGISLKLNISKVVIGMTVVAFCTSAPELIVSLKAAIDGFPDIALGNVVGSNIVNVGFILGLVAVIFPLQVHEKFIKKDWLQMILASLILYLVLFSGYEITRLEGFIMFGILIIWIVYMLKTLKPDEPTEELEQISNIYKILGFLTVGVVALYFGSDLLITGAVDLAKTFGVSERIIGVTVVAVGTSIPELAASVIAALKKESAIAIGNVVGSNIFNILGVLGLTAIISPIKMVDLRLFSFDMIWMLAFAFILLPLVFLPKKGFIDRKAGVILMIAYGVFLFMTFS
jgi:cation:H+ antiporter